MAGARPVFVDTTATNTIDVSKIEAAITPRQKAILPVSPDRSPADMPAVMQIADRHHLAVIEDAAQAFSRRSTATVGFVGIGPDSVCIPLRSHILGRRRRHRHAVGGDARPVAAAAEPRDGDTDEIHCGVETPGSTPCRRSLRCA